MKAVCILLLIGSSALWSTPVSAASLKFTSGWQNFGGAFGAAKSVRTGNVCVLSGLMRTVDKRIPTEAVTVGRLNSNCWPAAAHVFNLNNANSTARVDVFPNGNVIWRSGFNRAWLTLDGISFAVGNTVKAIAAAKGWQNRGGAWQGIGIARQGDLCLVSGVLTTTTAIKLPATVAVLPTSCRPPAALIFRLHANSHNPGTRVDVLPNGQVLVRKGAVKNWLSLSGISFRVKASGKQVPLVNKWVNYGGQWEQARYLANDGVCSVTGLIRGSNYGHIANLPEACRPSRRLVFNVHANTYDKATRVDVLPNGQVHWIIGGKGSWISLAGISYSVPKPVVAPAGPSTVTASSTTTTVAVATQPLASGSTSGTTTESGSQTGPTTGATTDTGSETSSTTGSNGSGSSSSGGTSVSPAGGVAFMPSIGGSGSCRVAARDVTGCAMSLGSTPMQISERIRALQSGLGHSCCEAITRAQAEFSGGRCALVTTDVRERLGCE